MKEYNIVNGDCLKTSLNNEYTNILVMREALCQGPIEDKNISEFFENRAVFISQEYKACTKEEYLEGIKEFETMKKIEDNSQINLWFGKDVFCQINFWFLLNFLKDKKSICNFYLISPQENESCSFENKSKQKDSYKNKTLITKDDYETFCKLWEAFKTSNYKEMTSLTLVLNKKYNFINETIEAIVNTKEIKKELKSDYEKNKDFAKIFRNFCEEKSIYGYGDLQVQYILEKSKKMLF